MKRSIKHVVVLCILVVMMMPTMAFAAEKPCPNNLSQFGLKMNVEQMQNLYSKYMPNLKSGFDLQALQQACSKLKAPPVTVKKPAAPVAAQKPVAPVAAQKPAAPVAAQKPVAPATPAVEKPAAPAESNSATGSHEAQVVELVNKERAAQGLSALKFNAELSKVAEAKAADLRDKNYFSHTSPTYGSPFDMMKSFGIRYTAAGENIAKGYMNPTSVMNGWMNSPGHKANIMNGNFTEIGVGYVSGSNGSGYWVQMFIRP
ncbi:MAG: CAP domain-containing protein [Anaerovoracaceae bacterium]